MSKERLDQYKKMLDVMINDESEMHRNRLKDTAFYFYKQAIERVQELEDILEQDARQGVLESLYEENKRYRYYLSLVKTWGTVKSVNGKHELNDYARIADVALEGDPNS